MTPTQHDRLAYALAVVSLVAFIAMALVGCSTGPGELIETRHLVIDANGYGGVIDTEALDALWEEVALCYGVDPNYHRAHINIVEPVKIGAVSGKQLILYPDGKTLVYGYSYYEYFDIYLPPDLSAAKHEFAEVISVEARGSRVHGSNPKCGM